MADVFTKKKRSEIMSAIRSRRNRSPELALASALRRAGIKGRRRHLPLPGRPDFVFPKVHLCSQTVVFGMDVQRMGRRPVSNQAYWLHKLQSNRSRDRPTP